MWNTSKGGNGNEQARSAEGSNAKGAVEQRTEQPVQEARIRVDGGDAALLETNSMEKDGQQPPHGLNGSEEVTPGLASSSATVDQPTLLVPRRNNRRSTKAKGEY